MCETGTGQQVAQLHDSYMMIMMIQYSSKVLRDEDSWVGVWGLPRFRSRGSMLVGVFGE